MEKKKCSSEQEGRQIIKNIAELQLGPSTPKFAKGIPIETLEFFTACLKIHQSYYKNRFRPDSPSELERISKALQKLKGKGYLTADGVEAIEKTMYEQLQETRPGMICLQNLQLVNLRKSGRRYKNDSFL